MKLIFNLLLKSRKNLKFHFYLSLFIFLIVIPGGATANSWKLVPENPVVGDTIEIRGTNFTGETADVLVSFEKNVQVSEGRYEYLLENVEIPPGFKNLFSVQATGADDLNVRVKMILWISRNAEAKEGIASISQSAVPPGTYRIRIDGKSNSSEVKLKITGLQRVKVDSGNFSYKYNTKSIPSGSFEIKAGNITKQITLKPAENLPSNTTTTSGQKEDSKKEFWKYRNILVVGGLSGGILLLFFSRVKKH